MTSTLVVSLIQLKFRRHIGSLIADLILSESLTTKGP